MSRARVVTFAVAAVVVAALVTLAVPTFSAIGHIVGTAAGYANTLLAPDRTRAAPDPRSTQPTTSNADSTSLGGAEIRADDLQNGCTLETVAVVTSVGLLTRSDTSSLIDTGPREYATGTVNRTPNGLISSYTVAPGDALLAIADRFCIWNAFGIATINGVKASGQIAPGDVLALDTQASYGK